MALAVAARGIICQGRQSSTTLPGDPEVPGVPGSGSKAEPLWVKAPALRCAGSSCLKRFPLMNSQTKHMFPSRPSSHLPLGNERTSARFLTGSADRRPSAPEEPGLDKQSQALPPTARAARPGGSPRLQATGPPGSLFSPTQPPSWDRHPCKWERRQGEGGVGACR